MSAARGVAVGVLTLTTLDLVVSTDQAASRVGGLFVGAANAVRAFISPEVPALRDRSGCLDHPDVARTSAAGGGGGGVLSGLARLFSSGGLVP